MYNHLNLKGVTIIEILCFIAIVGTIFALTVPAFQAAYNNGASILSALFFAGIVFVCVICILYFILWSFSQLLDRFFPSQPDYCELKKCYLYDCYFVRLGLLDGNFSIMYYKCRCGNEYVSYGYRFFAKVEDDGSLKPYIYNWTGVGWYRDNRINSEVHNYKIPFDILQQLRAESINDTFIHREKITEEIDVFVLNALTDLRNHL
jgi:hypothetical protein